VAKVHLNGLKHIILGNASIFNANVFSNLHIFSATTSEAGRLHVIPNKDRPH
jgi:hypothetical protein